MRAEQGPQSLLPSQVLSNLVMEELLPELRTTIGPRLKGKAQERQRTWIQVWGWGCRGWGGHHCLPSPACTASALGAALPPPFPAGLGVRRLSCLSEPALVSCSLLRQSQHWHLRDISNIEWR